MEKEVREDNPVKPFGLKHTVDSTNALIQPDMNHLAIPPNPVQNHFVNGLSLKTSPDIYLIDLKLDKHIEVKSSHEAGIAGNIVGDNVGLFFTHVFMAIFKEGEYEIRPRVTYRLNSGENRYFAPDLVTRTLSGDIYTEIKAVSTRRSEPSFNRGQEENYFNVLLKRVKEGQSRPVIREAIFRYGKNRKNLSLHGLNEVNAMKLAAQELRDSLILAPNQALLLFMLERLEHRESNVRNDPRDYYIVKGSTINLLTDYQKHLKNAKWDLDSFLDEFEMRFEWNVKKQRDRTQKRWSSYRVYKMRKKLRSAKIIARKDFMHLDDIAITSFPSDKHGPIGYQDMVLPSFPVTIYSIRNYDAWLKDFVQNRNKILKAAELRDLFQEDLDYAPF